MRSQKRSECRRLQPTCVQLTARTIVESAHIAADKRDARLTDICQQRDRKREMVPARVIITGPNGRESLDAREPCTRQNERTFFRTKLLNILERRSCHLHSEDIVIATVSSCDSV